MAGTALTYVIGVSILLGLVLITYYYFSQESSLLLSTGSSTLLQQISSSLLTSIDDCVFQSIYTSSECIMTLSFNYKFSMYSNNSHIIFVLENGKIFFDLKKFQELIAGRVARVFNISESNVAVTIKIEPVLSSDNSLLIKAKTVRRSKLFITLTLSRG